jgi:glycosyltransferase involved in cell wall biosynthesis
VKVLHVTHQYRPAVGGAEQYMIDLSEELVRRGHQVDVFTSRATDYMTWRNVQPAREQLDGVNVYRFWCLERQAWAWAALRRGYEGWWRTGCACYEPLVFLGNGPVSPGLFLSILRRARDYDLVHINNLHYAQAATAYTAARRRGLPVVITPHVHAEQRATYDVGYLRDILRGSDQVIADTRAEKEFLIELGVAGHKITVSGVGLKLQAIPTLDPVVCRRELGLPETGFILLFLSRQVEYKRLDVCLEAFAALKPHWPALQFVVAGPETDYSCQLLAQYAGAEGLLHIRGQVSDEVKWKLLWACDSFVLPSTAEAFGIVYLEAWAAGKPVIGARIPSVASLITDEQDGFLVTPGSAQELVARLGQLMGDPALRQRMGASGRAKLEARYTLVGTAEIAEGAYLRALRFFNQNRMSESGRV